MKKEDNNKLVEALKERKGMLEINRESAKKEVKGDTIIMVLFGVASVTNAVNAVSQFMRHYYTSGAFATAASVCFGVSCGLRAYVRHKSSQDLRRWEKSIDVIDEKIRKMS